MESESQREPENRYGRPHGDDRRLPSRGICRVAPLLSILLAALPARVSEAQDCETNPGGIYQTFPASGSRSVPRDGEVRVDWCQTVDPLIDPSATRLLSDRGGALAGCNCSAGEECVALGFEERCATEVEVDLESGAAHALLRSVTGLEPISTYFIEAPEPSGVTLLSFSTVPVSGSWDGFDRGAPTFEGITSIRIRGCGGDYPSNPACPRDVDEQGFAALLQAEAARDDVGRINVEYRAFLVREGEELLLGESRGDGADDVSMTVFVPDSELLDSERENLCFRMTARDFYGNETDTERTLCEETPEYSPFGSLCRVSPEAGGDRGWPLLGVLLLLALARACSARNLARKGSRSL